MASAATLSGPESRFWKANCCGKNPLFYGRGLRNPSGVTHLRIPNIQKREMCKFKVLAASGDGTGNLRRNSAQYLRKLLSDEEITLAPACHDALSGKLVEMAGFDMTFMSGFAVSAARAALPDAGLISYGEMLDQGQKIASAITIPLIADADNGYGNAMNVKRTVRGYKQAGIAGILIEDQLWPKGCGHTRGRKVVSREEAVMKIKAAVDARDEGGDDILIVARTDARQAISLEEAIWRAKAFEAAGADMVFIDALTSKEEMKRFCDSISYALKMANMLEGGGLTPFLSPIEFQDLGYNVIAYPLSLIGVSIRSMQDALKALKSGRIPPPSSLPSFSEIKSVVGFDDYYAEEEKYKIDFDVPSPTNQSSTSPATPPTPPIPPTPVTPISPLDSSTSASSYSFTKDELLNDGANVITEKEVSEESVSVFYPQRNTFTTKMLRIKVISSIGSTKLDFRIPAGFLGGLANIIPSVTGIDLEKLVYDSLNRASNTNYMASNQILDFVDKSGDRIQIFVE